jgi:signal transduction histidine kinase
MSDPRKPFEDIEDVPFPRLVNFVRQITHDVRNGLNAIDLQSAYIAEIAGETEVSVELGKLRKMVAHVTRGMQELSGRFAELRPVIMEYPVEEFLEGLKERVGEEFETQAKRIVWEIKTGSQEMEMEMDYSLLTSILLELVRNAIFFREKDHPIHFTAWDEGAGVVFEVRQVHSEPVTDAKQWGVVPLDSSRRGGYGLGLFYVRRILDTLGGTLEPCYDKASGELRVRLVMPLKGHAKPDSTP